MPSHCGMVLVKVHLNLPAVAQAPGPLTHGLPEVLASSMIPLQSSSFPLQISVLLGELTGLMVSSQAVAPPSRFLHVRVPDVHDDFDALSEYTRPPSLG